MSRSAFSSLSDAEDLRSILMQNVLDRVAEGGSTANAAAPAAITVVSVVRCCPWWVRLLAGVMVAYIAASLVYVLATRRLGTPFNDSLTNEQRRIKSESSMKRGTMFGISFAVALALVLLCWGMI